MREHEILAELWDGHAADLECFVRRRVGSAERAEDITSEVFVAAARWLKNNDGGELTVGFLYTVARRRVVDHWRRQARDEKLERACSAAAMEEGSELYVAIGEDFAWLRALPIRQRTALVLRYVHDLTVGQVAELMDESYSAVESLLARGRRSARTYYVA